MSSDETTTDAEQALASFYERVVELERTLAITTRHADQAEDQLIAVRRQLVTTEADRDGLRDEVARLGDELAGARAEIDALNNTATMRLAAVPRRYYAKLRNA